MLEKGRFRFPMDLQIFAEGDTGGGGTDSGDGGAASSNAGGEPFVPVTSGWGLPAGHQAAAEQGSNPLFEAPAAPAPAAPIVPEAAPAPQVIEISGRKIEVPANLDPGIVEALKAVQGDYTNLQQKLTQDSTRMKELESLNGTLSQTLQTLQTQAPAQPAQPAAPQPTAEDIAAQNAAFLESFWENPMEAIAKQAQDIAERMFTERVNPVIEPIKSERQMATQIQSLVQSFPTDGESMLPQMNQVLTENPDLMQQVRDGKMSLETVYFIAKGKTAQQAAPAAPAPTPEQLMSDPTFIAQILAKPEIQQQVMSTYMANKQNTNQLIPPVMGGGGQAPSAPGNRPTSVSEGTKAWAASWM